MSDKKKRKKT